MSDRIQAIRTRLKLATLSSEAWTVRYVDGMWGVYAGVYYRLFQNLRLRDASLIAHAPSDLRWALEEIERLQDDKTTLRAALYEHTRDPRYSAA